MSSSLRGPMIELLAMAHAVGEPGQRRVVEGADMQRHRGACDKNGEAARPDGVLRCVVLAADAKRHLTRPLG